MIDIRGVIEDTSARYVIIVVRVKTRLALFTLFRRGKKQKKKKIKIRLYSVVDDQFVFVYNEKKKIKNCDSSFPTHSVIEYFNFSSNK